MQYSVYEGRFHSQGELDKMIAKINRIINPDEDSIRIYPMGRNFEKDIVILGKGEIFDIENEYIF
ncbi:MAG: CRISPR-associated endonuclease Cas2 [Leptospiraceae bacterium]|nr:CRISPR-associated endonuclease Cas2 [Leptospiraceae bacterium]MCP5494012.1 CRISPR-associated endonuclease Cas2 [Leptospiraceae bacterium]